MEKRVNALGKTNKFSRIAAYLIDYIIILLLTSVVAFYSINTKLNINYIILDKLPREFRVLYDVIAITVAIIAIVIIPLINKGRTIGKTIMHLDLKNNDNTSISNKKILLRQGIIIFLFGGILNPNHIYLVDFLNLNMNNLFQYFQILVNGFSIFCGFTFLFTKGDTTLYDKYLKLNINVNKS